MTLTEALQKIEKNYPISARFIRSYIAELEARIEFAANCHKFLEQKLAAKTQAEIVGERDD